jgi:TRAP-type C4-dicarboxylate transport system substrate-binding protein
MFCCQWFNGVKQIVAGIFLVDLMNWNKLPERNRLQLMKILGEMAVDALKAVQKTREDNDEYPASRSATAISHPIWKNSSLSS